MTDLWKETTLQTILTNQAKIDINNADEFGLFFKALLKKTLHLKDEKCTGGKHSKIRVTGLADANMNGDKQTTNVCHWQIAKTQMFQEYKQITLPLPRPEQKLDGFNPFRRMGQRA